MRSPFQHPGQRWILGGLWGCVFCVVANVQLIADDTTTPTPVANYLKDIKPVLKDRCFACHGVLQQKGNLRLDTVALMNRGGDGGPVIVAGKPDESELVARITSTDMSTRMPPEGHALTAEQVLQIRRWLEQGAPADTNETPEADPREHWAFRPPVKAPLPPATDGTIPTNPIDAFINNKLESAQLKPRPAADKATQLRRVTLDLIGLPPTTEELHAFLADESPHAYEAVVERLLNDPRYGERWARHWMDVWRYADWHGRRHVPDVWNSAPQVWRWRDWIVRSLNSDHGYDRMVREMLAADELVPEDQTATVATAYLIRNWYALNHNDWMRANVEHTSKAFLGLTMNCAHCHDHKYDPISQDDYFRFRACFETINIRQDRVPGEADPGPFQDYSYGVLRKIQRLGAVQIYEKTPDAPTWFYTGGDERNRVAERGSIPPGIPTFLGGEPLHVETVSLPLTAWNPALRPEILEMILADQKAAITRAEADLATARVEVEKTLPPLKEALTTTEKEFASLQQAAVASGQTGVLEGQQSLVLHAATGRRMIQNPLSGLKALETGTTISFQLRLLQEAHFNFQLAKDFTQGQTASFVGFEQGRILAYQPGGTSEFQAGTYDPAAGQQRFTVTIELDLPGDRCLLTVRSQADDKVLVDKTPIALNGWNPIGDPQKGILLDARPGTIAAVDDLLVRGPQPANGEPISLVEYRFEAPACRDQTDIVGVDGWAMSKFSQQPATSLTVTTIGNEALLTASQKLHAARRAVAAQELRIAANEARIAATQAEIASIEARAAAERARDSSSPDADELILVASTLSREAALKKAQADVFTQDLALATAEAKPVTDANRAKEADASSQGLQAAREALAKAEAAKADPALATTLPSIAQTYPKTSTGRRRALAQWVTARENPLTARVAINHLWLRHFQAPLVATVFDFGRNGADPTHPELLDWLAVELMESGWSMKHLHRLIVSSDAYRRVSSVGDPALYASDVENKLLWRMNTGRMEAEVIRDSLLFVSGRLDQTQGGQELENSEALKTFRRSLYYSCNPEVDGKSEFGALFDAPEPAECYRRTRSVIPQQALALSNSDLVHELSVQLASALWQNLSMEQQSNSQAFITSAFEKILNRFPTENELGVCMSFLDEPQTTTGSVNSTPADPVKLRESLIRSLLNHNDFVSIR